MLVIMIKFPLLMDDIFDENDFYGHPMGIATYVALCELANAGKEELNEIWFDMGYQA